MTDDPKAPDTRPGADITDGATGRPYSQVGEKSAGQLLYEAQPPERDSAGREVSPLRAYWDQLPPSDQKRWEFNATVTPKAQTIKAP